MEKLVYILLAILLILIASVVLHPIWYPIFLRRASVGRILCSSDDVQFSNDPIFVCFYDEKGQLIQCFETTFDFFALLSVAQNITFQTDKEDHHVTTRPTQNDQHR